eukprot:scaffold24096_cov64-Phaeocystis_antarctica.AAC.6
MTTLIKNNDKLEHDELEHDMLSLHGMNLTSKEKPKWWECGGHVRGKKQSCESDAAGERGRASGASGQGVEKEMTKLTKFAWELAGHKPGMMSEFGGIAGSWLAQPQQGAAARTKEAARVNNAEARGLASETETEAPKQANA